MHERHAEFFLRLAQSLEPTYESIEIHGAQRHDIAVLEQGNLRAALDVGRRAAISSSRLALAVSLEGFWVALSPHEAVRRFASAARSAKQTCPSGCDVRVAGGVSQARAQFAGRIEDSIELTREEPRALSAGSVTSEESPIMLNRLGDRPLGARGFASARVR